MLEWILIALAVVAALWLAAFLLLRWKFPPDEE